MENNAVLDHKGNMFKDVKTMCKYYNIDYATYTSRIIRGWETERALLTPIGKQGNRCLHPVDHLGNKYRSIKEMCLAYDIRQSVYYNRRKLGWSLETILTTEDIGEETIVTQQEMRKIVKGWEWTYKGVPVVKKVKPTW